MSGITYDLSVPPPGYTTEFRDRRHGVTGKVTTSKVYRPPSSDVVFRSKPTARDHFLLQAVPSTSPLPVQSQAASDQVAPQGNPSDTSASREEAAEVPPNVVELQSAIPGSAAIAAELSDIVVERDRPSVRRPPSLRNPIQ